MYFYNNYQKGIEILLLSQFSFLTFYFFSSIYTRKFLSAFFRDISMKMDKMINRESIETTDFIDDTYISQIYHRLYKLYDILSEEQRALKKEKDKLQIFISDISHQIKTPITNLKLINSTLTEVHFQISDYNNYLQIQNQQIEKIEFLLQSLIKTSKLANGMIHLKPELASINSTILSALECVIMLAEKKDITIVFNNSNNYNCFHDIKWTAEAIFNILENSIKYTPQHGKISIFINQTQEYIKITVTDTGIGISKDDISNIFERFWRGSNAKLTDGNGIGLYLSKKIIILQNGYILVNSTIGNGTKFEICTRSIASTLKN